MKLSWGLLAAVIFAIGLNSCFEAPTYPLTPEIEFGRISFINVPVDTVADTLALTIKFKDGDGDLGLAADETGCYDVNGKVNCYNDKFYYRFSDGTYISYKTKRTKPGYDTLPAFVKPYTCTNWEVIKKPDPANKDQFIVVDTLYFKINQNNKNIFVDFFVKQNDGSFVEFDWLKEFCSTYDGRFPVLSKDLRKPSPLEGEIRYGMPSVGFLGIFSTKTLKLRVSIQDRALNRSNVIETPEFRFR
jgi:hypothetical protein